MSDKPITIRTATLNDTQWLLEMASITFFDAYADVIPADVLRNYIQEAFTMENLMAELSNSAITFLIAQSDDVPTGYAALNRSTPPQTVSGENPIELQRIYVMSNWIGHGIGATLMKACLESATAQNCDVIWLGVWEHNHRAQKFYQKWGFEFCGKHSFQLGNIPQVDLLMQRDLA